MTVPLLALGRDFGNEVLLFLVLLFLVVGVVSGPLGLGTCLLLSRMEPARRSRAARVARPVGAALPGAALILFGVIASGKVSVDVPVLFVFVTVLSTPGSIFGVWVAEKIIGPEIPPGAL